MPTINATYVEMAAKSTQAIELKTSPKDLAKALAEAGVGNQGWAKKLVSQIDVLQKAGCGNVTISFPLNGDITKLSISMQVEWDNGTSLQLSTKPMALGSGWTVAAGYKVKDPTGNGSMGVAVKRENIDWTAAKQMFDQVKADPFKVQTYSNVLRPEVGDQFLRAEVSGKVKLDGLTDPVALGAINGLGQGSTAWGKAVKFLANASTVELKSATAAKISRASVENGSFTNGQDQAVAVSDGAVLIGRKNGAGFVTGGNVVSSAFNSALANLPASNVSNPARYTTATTLRNLVAFTTRDDLAAVNFGLNRVLGANVRQQLDKGTSVWSLSSLAQGKNGGESSLALANEFNRIAREYGYLTSLTGEQLYGGLKVRNPSAEETLYYKTYIHNTDQAMRMLHDLKYRLPQAEYKEIVGRLANQQGLNFGDPDLEAINQQKYGGRWAPNRDTAVNDLMGTAAKSTTIRDWNVEVLVNGRWVNFAHPSPNGTTQQYDPRGNPLMKLISSERGEVLVANGISDSPSDLFQALRPETKEDHWQVISENGVSYYEDVSTGKRIKLGKNIEISRGENTFTNTLGAILGGLSDPTIRTTVSTISGIEQIANSLSVQKNSGWVELADGVVGREFSGTVTDTGGVLRGIGTILGGINNPTISKLGAVVSATGEIINVLKPLDGSNVQLATPKAGFIALGALGTVIGGDTGKVISAVAGLGNTAIDVYNKVNAADAAARISLGSGIAGGIAAGIGIIGSLIGGRTGQVISLVGNFVAAILLSNPTTAILGLFVGVAQMLSRPAPHTYLRTVTKSYLNNNDTPDEIQRDGWNRIKVKLDGRGDFRQVLDLSGKFGSTNLTNQDRYIDVTGDGITDLVWFDEGMKGAAVWTGDGNGGFSSRQMFADFNTPGWRGNVSYTDRTNERNPRTVNIQAPRLYRYAPERVSFADRNEDGFVDIVVDLTEFRKTTSDKAKWSEFVRRNGDYFFPNTNLDFTTKQIEAIRPNLTSDTYVVLNSADGLGHFLPAIEASKVVKVVRVTPAAQLQNSLVTALGGLSADSLKDLGISRDAGFNPYAYLASYPDLYARVGLDEVAAARDFLDNGLRNGRGITFNAMEYLAANNDLIDRFGTDAVAAAKHWLQYGKAENRSRTFNAYAYIASYVDLIEAFGADREAGIDHYVEFGRRENRSITFDALAYVASYPDLIPSIGTDEVKAAKHYLEKGLLENRWVSFNPFAYLVSQPDLARSFGTDARRATLHFIQSGYNEGRRVTFDGLAYLATYADLARFGTDAWAGAKHFLTDGSREGRTITFNPYAYLASQPDVLLAKGIDANAASQHYIKYGRSEGRQTTFDARLYLASNPDLVKSAIRLDQAAAAKHWLESGSIEGRSPDSFNAFAYLASNPDLIASLGVNAANATTHWLTHGIPENRKITFDPLAYVAANDDLAGQDARTAALHWLNHGRFENRSTAPTQYATGRTLLGFTGNQWIYGGGGADVYVLSAATGQDQVVDAGGVDSVYLAPGTRLDQIRLERSPEGLRISAIDGGRTGSIFIANRTGFLGTNSIEKIRVGTTDLDLDQLFEAYQPLMRDDGSIALGDFNPWGYLASHRDVGNDPVKAIAHWIQFGQREGRQITFNAYGYLASHADVASSTGNDPMAAARHYVLNGRAEGQGITFDVLGYLASYRDLALAMGTDAAAGNRHYVTIGRGEGRQITFDHLQYVAANPDLIPVIGNDRARAVDHYLRNGARENRITSFNGLAYVAVNPDLIPSIGVNQSKAAEHYNRHGKAENRRTSGFDTLGYVASNPDLIPSIGVDVNRALTHWIQSGHRENRVTTTFSGLAYVAVNPDLIPTIGTNLAKAAEHYITNGRRENRRTSGFDTLGYVASNPDLIPSIGLDVNKALTHWIQYGKQENRVTTRFVAEDYLTANPDLARTGIISPVAAATHFIRSGATERRATTPIAAVARNLGAGNDNLDFNIGSGALSVTDAGGNDRLRFGAGITLDSLVLDLDGPNRTEVIINAQNRVILNKTGANSVETIQFANRSQIDVARLVQAMGAFADPGTGVVSLNSGSARQAAERLLVAAT